LPALEGALKRALHGLGKQTNSLLYTITKKVEFSFPLI
jgi:hypothetical protein